MSQLESCSCHGFFVFQVLSFRSKQVTFLSGEKIIYSKPIRCPNESPGTTVGNR